MKNAGWLLFGIAVCFIILLQLCNKAVKEDAVDTKALEKRIADTAHYYRQRITDDSVKFSKAATESKANYDRWQGSKADLSASKATINRLVAKIEAAGRQPENDSWVKVSPDYKEGCDSLVKENKALSTRVDQSEVDAAEQYRLMMYEIALRDSAIFQQKEFNRKFLNQLDDCMGQLQAKASQQPRNQVYAGIGMFGNQINPLSGGQVNISLRTKRNQIYEVTGATVGNTWYGGIGTKFLISFRR